MAEPILWANKAEALRRIPARAYNPKTGQMEQLIDADTGIPMHEKIPQRSHIGDYDKPQIVARPWLHVLRHDGHVCRIPITSAAAHVDPHTNQGRYMHAKASHLGWIRVGYCPGALVIGGTIKANSLVSKEAIDSVKNPCANGTYSETKWCPHYMAEEAARKTRQGRVQEKRDATFKSDADKILESHKEIVTGVAEAVAEAVTRSQAKPSDPVKAK